MRVLIRAGLALAAAASLAACGAVSAPSARTPSATGHRQAHATGTATDLTAPPAGSRGEAAALARRLLARLELPAGARRLPPEPVPAALRHPALFGLAAASLDRHQLYALPEPMAAVAGFLTSHRPPGTNWFSDGTLSGPGGVQSQAVSFTVGSVPDGVYRAQLAFTVAPGASGGSVLRADAQVLWYPLRSAAEYIDPLRYHVLTITVTIWRTKPRTVHRVVTSQAAIARLADVLDSSPALPSMTVSCPVSAATYRLSFAVTRHGPPAVIVRASQAPCEGIQVRADGRGQPSLQAASSVVKTADQLIGFNPRP